MNNELNTDLEFAEKETMYDRSAKRLLQNKQILAIILKGAATQFEDMSLYEIEEALGNDTERMIRLSEENYEPGHGTVYFDELVQAKTGRNKVVFVDLEPHIYQSSDSHTLLLEGMYKWARLVVAQGNTIFSTTKREYGKICGVIAVWIIFHAKKEDRGAIEKIRLSEKSDRKIVSLNSIRDMMDLILITVPELSELTDQDNYLMRVLSTLFSQEIGSEERIARLKSLGIRMTVKLEEEIRMRSGLKEWLDQKYNEGMMFGKAEGMMFGKAEGMAAGKAEGMAAGKAEGMHLMSAAIDEAITLIQKGYRIKDILETVSKKYELDQNAERILYNVLSFHS